MRVRRDLHCDLFGPEAFDNGEDSIFKQFWRRKDMISKSDEDTQSVCANAKSAAKHLKSLLELSEMHDVTTVMMIGEYSHCLMLQEWVIELLPDKQVFVPSLRKKGCEITLGARMFKGRHFGCDWTTTENSNYIVLLH